MEYLLDTSFLIGYLRGEKNALAIFSKLMYEKLFICPISHTQILTKVRPRESFEATQYFLNSFESLAINQDTAIKAGVLGYDLARRGVTIPDTDDLIINILCQENDLTLVTSNLKHFPNKNIKILEYKY